MTSLSHCARGAAAFGVALSLHPAISAQTEYEGNGFVVPTPHEDDVTRVEILDLDGDGLTDVATLDASGDLYVHFDALSLQSRQLAGPFTDVSVTRDPQEGDRLWGLQQNTLVEVTPNGATLTGTDSGIDVSSATGFSTYDTDGGSLLTLIEDGGETVNRYALLEDRLELEASWSSDGYGSFHDARTIAWYGTDELCVAAITDVGLVVLEPDGDVVSVNGTLPGMADGALIEVLRGEHTQFGHDLLIHLYRPSSTMPAPMVALNAFHVEVMSPDAGVIGSIDSGNFLGEDYHQLIFKRNDEPTAYLFKHVQAGTESQPFFVFDPYDLSILDFSATLEPLQLDGGGGSRPTATADVDFDGDQDLIAVNESGELLVMTGTAADEDELVRAQVQDQGAAIVTVSQVNKVSFDVGIELPSGATGIDWEIWGQDDLESELHDDVLGYGSYTPSPPSSTFSHTVEGDLVPSASGDEVYQLLIRATNSSGTVYQTWITYWSPDSSTLAELIAQTDAVYPWRGGEEDMPGGTVRRPVLGPPMGSH